MPVDILVHLLRRPLTQINKELLPVMLHDVGDRPIDCQMEIFMDFPRILIPHDILLLYEEKRCVPAIWHETTCNASFINTKSAA